MNVFLWSWNTKHHFIFASISCRCFYSLLDLLWRHNGGDELGRIRQERPLIENYPHGTPVSSSSTLLFKVEWVSSGMTEEAVQHISSCVINHSHGLLDFDTKSIRPILCPCIVQPELKWCRTIERYFFCWLSHACLLHNLMPVWQTASSSQMPPAFCLDTSKPFSLT